MHIDGRIAGHAILFAGQTQLVPVNPRISIAVMQGSVEYRPAPGPAVGGRAIVKLMPQGRYNLAGTGWNEYTIDKRIR